MAKLVQALIFFVLLAVRPLEATPTPPSFSSNQTPVFSSSRLFHVAGGSSLDNVKMATFAEKIQKAVVERMRLSVPRFSGSPILITLRTHEDQPPRVERYQRYASRALDQEVLIINPDQSDQEHILEALTWCLLNRYGIIRQAAASRKRIQVKCPEWLSTGLAQTLFPLSQSRNRRLLSSTLSRQSIHSVGEILTWTRLPNHRPVTHAECELQFLWLVDENADFLEACLERLAAEQDLGLEWIKGQCGLESDRQLMMRRDVWAAREVLSLVSLRPYQAADVRELQTLLNLEWPLFELFLDLPAQETASLTDLILALPSRESRETLFLLQRELTRLNAGKSGPLYVWSNSFVEFLQELLSSEEAPDPQQRLLRELQKLEQQRRHLMGEWLDRDRYLDRFEQGD